ncbi:HesA/MoeB/ThiF family protein [Xenorhabdus sp. 42]|uniref:HesA/MoeB/ThiF family protein n=1 Tax=Xenorhabdus szentirmaii TaxID=290112 RepID=UPI0019BD9EF6|nr:MULTISPECIES: HesA/MoeB/ThiF family protein [unclassified Xenorhabdus]MBD2794386.1 HesA/MoeB/ThiF family protein [Xenorhabdus sp. CUL]MBD2822169.1 HesA/MoeB/ThiF family protein [Xenorhabdus sp. 42]MBD2827097.1 HesA/MoeB/ThiF family protein [Xenorhabdus sp. 5]
MNDERYDRQIKVIGNDGQEKLKKASVLIIGCGGLGCPISLYMSTAGVGKITLVDDDVVSLSNLHRQILFEEDDIGKLKVDVAKRKLLKLNSNIEITGINDRINASNSANYVDNHDIVIVGCDNLETRYIVNDTCCKMGTPYINASVLGDEGSIAYFDIVNGCYRCIFPNAPKDKLIPLPADIGVFGPLVGVIGTATATMAIEILIGNELKYINKMFTFDSLTLKMKGHSFSKDECCRSCSI